jgi:hypothetical protein
VSVLLAPTQEAVAARAASQLGTHGFEEHLEHGLDVEDLGEAWGDTAGDPGGFP